jgi:hypothetical protein
MDCTACKNRIAPGLEIIVNDLLRERAHCPYCLEILNTESILSEADIKEVSAKRSEMRQRIREQFADRLIRESSDGQLRCPVCDRRLNGSDEQLLRNGEYYKCHLCGHDLAAVAYRQEAYHEQRWLPVVFALQDQAAGKLCGDCCYAGAVAKACQRAYSWMPESESKPHRFLADILRQPHRSVLDCDWKSCVAVKQYRKLAGEGLLLL